MAELVELVRRLELAASHQRAARVRQLRAQQVELLALEQLAVLDGLTPGHLASRLGLTSGGVSALADRLVNAGLVARRPHARDRRMRVLIATPAGRACLEEYLEPISAPTEQALSWLASEDREVVARFVELLTSLKESAAAVTPAPENEGSGERYESALLM